MSMMDLYNYEEAVNTLEQGLETRDELLKELDKVQRMIIILEYYIATGEELDPEILGIEPPDDVED